MTNDQEQRKDTGAGGLQVGDISGNVGAIGYGSTGSVSVGGTADPALAEVQQRLAELRALVEQHTAELDDADAARAAVAAADRELRSGDARPTTLRMLLSAVVGAAPGVSAISAAVKDIRGLLGTLG